VPLGRRAPVTVLWRCLLDGHERRREAGLRAGTLVEPLRAVLAALRVRAADGVLAALDERRIGALLRRLLRRLIGSTFAPCFVLPVISVCHSLATRMQTLH
jgi:hypothetical protein